MKKCDKNIKKRDCQFLFLLGLRLEYKVLKNEETKIKISKNVIVNVYFFLALDWSIKC